MFPTSGLRQTRNPKHAMVHFNGLWAQKGLTMPCHMNEFVQSQFSDGILNSYMYQIAHVPLYWEYKKLYPGGGTKLLPPPPHLLCQWRFYFYTGQELDTYELRNMFLCTWGGCYRFFLTCDYFRCGFFIQIRTTWVSANIAKYVVGHFIFLSYHHALSYLPSQWSCGWSSLPEISR